MPEAASSVATWSTEQMMLEMVQVRIATGVTRVVWTAVVLRCGKQMEKLPHYHFSWIVSFQKLRYHVCEMLGDRRGYSHLKEEALDRIKWRNCFRGGFGPVVWQITIMIMIHFSPSELLLLIQDKIYGGNTSIMFIKCGFPIPATSYFFLTGRGTVLAQYTAVTATRLLRIRLKTVLNW
jgi:hypothetical protein